MIFKQTKEWISQP